MESIHNEMSKTKDWFENNLKRHFQFEMGISDLLETACYYAVEDGGKRIRPVLLLKMYELFDEKIHQALPLAIALELIHSYSLVHDDLPCMDDDIYRRNKLTVHKKFGEDIAVLTGDCLLNKAYEILLDDLAQERNELIRIRKIKAAAYMSKMAGFHGMIGGQILDIGNQTSTQEELFKMYRMKTCALIQAACYCGAILGGASANELEYIEQYGYHVGLAFQIKDDLLDAKQDCAINKTTVLSYLNIEKTNEYLMSLANQAKTDIQRINKETSFFQGLVDILLARQS